MLNIWLDWDGMQNIVLSETKVFPSKTTPLSPFYADGRGNEEFRIQQERDKETGKKKEELDSLFTQGKWDDAQSIVLAISDHFPGDFMFQVSI